MKDLLIYANMGLGDAIILNGLVRHLAKERNVMFLCKLHNHPSVSWMFKDANVLTVAVVDDVGAEGFIAERGDKVEVLRLGCTGVGWTTGQDFDQTMYRQAGVPFEQRWDGFHVQRPPQQHRVPPYPFRFIHDDATRGFSIADPLGDLPIVRAVYDKESPNIFAWTEMLEAALEIHCIPSSFAHLADSLTLRPDAKLFLHGSARPGWDKHTSRKDWQIV